MGQCASKSQHYSSSQGNSSGKQREMITEDARAVLKLGSQMQGASLFLKPTPPPPLSLWGKKRIGVTAESSVASHVSVVPKSDKTKLLIADAIRENLLFQDMPTAAMEVIIDSMHSVSVPPGTDIIRQGDTHAAEFYVMEEGLCEVWVKPPTSRNPHKVLMYSAGSCFGELALLYSAPRAATVRAATQCKLWIMERSVYHAVKRNFTHEAYVARHALLDSVPSLKHLSPHHKALLVDALKQEEFKPGKAVFRQGDAGDKFYIVREGTAVVKDASGALLAKLGVGQYFGERALMGAEVRAADVYAETRLLVYSLARQDFNDLLGSHEDIWRFEALQKVPLLYNLSERQLWQLAKAMTSHSFDKGQVAFHKGDPGDRFYIIQEGVFSCIDGNGKELARVSEGSCFGELSLLKQDVRAATVVALTAARVLTLHRDQFTRLLGNLAQLRHVWRFEALRKVPLLTTLSNESLSRLAQALQPATFRAKTDVIQEGETGDKFFIVEHGELGVFKAGNPGHAPIKVYAPGTYFGELALLTNEPRAATVRALSDVALLVLDRAHFHQLLGPLLPAMQKEAENYLLRSHGTWQTKSRSNKSLQLDRARVLTQLGAGGFGQVLLVEYMQEYYALKCINKPFVLEQGLVEHVKREKDAMAECDCPFLVKLVGTAQDDRHLYMMMEAVMGGELFSYLQTRTRPLDESHARFYIASVVLALEYLHDRQLVYRDLKPENLLLDLQGYCKVTDLGFVKRIKPGGKTYTLCGTPEYLAPEIIMNKGHSFPADWWALGVLAYELCNGMPPFMDDDRLVMFRKVCSTDFTMPRHFSPALRHLVQRLLEPNPVFRLGCGKTGAAEIKEHPWFSGFSWDDFMARAMPAPYLPKQPKHGGDSCNFHPTEAKGLAFRTANYVSKHGNFSDF